MPAWQADEGRPKTPRPVLERRILAALAAEDAAPRDDHADETHRLPPVGTTLIKRDRHGNEIGRCTIVEAGVEYSGTKYRSLSGAALAAIRALGGNTKTINGWAWWGLAAVREAHRRSPTEMLAHAFERYSARAALLATGSQREEVIDELRRQAESLAQIADAAT